MCISLSQQIGLNCTSPFNAGEIFRIHNTFVLVSAVIGASDEVLYPFYSALNISANGSPYEFFCNGWVYVLRMFMEICGAKILTGG